MYKSIIIFICVLFVSSCETKPTLQKYYVKNTESADFVSQLNFQCDAVVHLGSIPSPVHDSDEKVFHNSIK